MNNVNFGSNIRVGWTCPECKNKNEIGLPALFYVIQKHYMIECSACGDSFYASADISERAEKLSPLEKRLSLALQCASVCNSNSSCASWGNPSPFQNEINKLLEECGRNVCTCENLVDEPDGETGK